MEMSEKSKIRSELEAEFSGKDIDIDEIGEVNNGVVVKLTYKVGTPSLFGEDVLESIYLPPEIRDEYCIEEILIPDVRAPGIKRMFSGYKVEITITLSEINN